MVSCSDEASLTPNKNRSSERTVKEPLDFQSVVKASRQHNRVVLEQLKRRQEWLQFLCHALGSGELVRYAFFSPSVLVTLPPPNVLLGTLQTVSQRIILMEWLVEAFQEEGIKIHSGISLEGARQIDFFLAFPDKEFLLVQNRSLGDSKVFYNEKTEALQFMRKGGGLKTWEPDPLVVLAVQEKALRKTRRDLFGGSSRDQRRPLSKLLILWGGTSLGTHSRQMYETIGGYLTIRKIGTANIVENKQAIDFIRAYLTHNRSRKGL